MADFQRNKRTEKKANGDNLVDFNFISVVSFILAVLLGLPPTSGAL